MSTWFLGEYIPRVLNFLKRNYEQKCNCFLHLKRKFNVAKEMNYGQLFSVQNCTACFQISRFEVFLMKCPPTYNLRN